MPSEGERTAEVSLWDLVRAHRETLSSLGEELSSGKRLLLHLDHEKYLDCAELPDSSSRCVFGVCRETACSELCEKFVDSMRACGGSVVLDSDTDPVALDRLSEKCDIIKVSLAGKTPAEIVGIRQKYKTFSGKLLATDITSWEAFEGTRALGFRYFQGPFFALPQLQEDKELPTGSIAKLQLLRELNNPGCEMEELSSIIAGDVALSYRILKYINSASFGVKNQIKSIQQAVSLLGLTELKHWATVVVMTDIDSTAKGEELAYMALQRGRFLSNLSRSIKGFKYSPNTMFLLGMFSKLDALLSYPMDKALHNIPLDEEMKKGLCGVKNDFHEWVMTLEAIESGNWQVANEILGRYGACFTQAATNYMKASTWAAQQLPEIK